MQQSVEDEGEINMMKDEHCSEIKVSESYQHLGHLNTIKSEPSVFGIQSGCDEEMNEKTDASEDNIQDCKYFIQQSLEEEGKLWDSLHTISSKRIGTTECFPHTTLVEGAQLGIGIQSGCDEILNREPNVSGDEAEDNKYVIQQYLKEEGKLCNNIETSSLKKDGIPEFLQHCDSNTLVKSEHSDFGIQSGSDERMNEKSDVSEDAIEDSKYFIQQSLHKEGQLWDSIDTTSSKEVRTIECSQNRAVESAQTGIGIHLGCDEIMDRETSESEDEDSKSFIVQYLDEEGKLCNNIDTIPLKKEGAARELHKNELLEMEDEETNTCEDYLDEHSTTRRSNPKSHNFDVHQRIDKSPLFEYSTGSNLQRPVDTAHPEMKTNKCQPSISNRSNLKFRVVSVHLKADGAKKHNCQLCDYSALNSETLQLHVNREHQVTKNYTCHFCDFSTPESSNLKCHIEDVHFKMEKHENHLSGVSTAYSSSLNGYNDAVHLKEEIGKTLKCHLCAYTSTSILSLKCHITCHSKRNKYKCHFCEYCSISTSNLKTHINSVHLKIKNHKCLFCDSSFTNSRNLHRHIDGVHLNVRRHKCHLCYYSSAYSSDIKCHFDSVHLRVKKHKCHLCSYSSAYKGDLKCHIDGIHLKVKKHKCPSCDFSSSFSGNLKCHVDTVSDLKV